MLTMLPGKRQWQRVADVTAACEKRQREEDDEESIISDKTRLLSSWTSEHPDFDQVLDTLHAEEDESPSQSTWTHDGLCVSQHTGPWFSSFAASNLDHSKRTRKQDPDCPSFPIRKHCHHAHASWKGFKQLVRKQFMPSFPFGKEMPREEMQHLRQRRMEGAMDKASRVLGASTNLVELRKLDAKIQNGINKSAFVASTRKGKSKENLNCNHDRIIEISKAVKLSSQTEFSSNASVSAEVMKINASKDDCRMRRNRNKENGLLRKLKGQTKKDPMFLLASSLH